MLIVNAYRDLMETSVSIGKRFNVSDTYAHKVFNRYVKLNRLTFTDAISIDEVHIDMDNNGKYALVIQDFYTGNPIDMLRNRKSSVTEPYFASIPFEERCGVKYLISDMYNPYISYVDKFFPNAVAVVDSFHVIQWIIHKLDNYIRQLIKKYKQRDKELYQTQTGDYDPRTHIPLSDEVYLLQKYRWLVLANQANITYHSALRIDPHFHCLMNTYDYESALFNTDKNLEEYRELKELYIDFNNRNAGNPIAAKTELEELIDIYYTCNHLIFREFGDLLEHYKEPIINSFIMVEKIGPGGLYNSRLSNEPIESINRKVKDLKRMGRGYKNFEHFRNRFLYSTRNNPVLDGVADFNPVKYFEEDDF